MISLIATKFGNTLKADDLRHLGVSVHIVQTVATLHQRIEQTTM